MGVKLEEFFTQLGFKIDEAALKKYQGHLDGMHKSLRTLSTLALVDAGRRLLGFVERSIGGAAEVQKFAESTNMAAEEVAAMSKAVRDADITAEEMRGTILGVAQATGAAAAKMPRYTKLFKGIGIDAIDPLTGKAKSAVVVMGELADKFRRMDDSTRLAVAGRLGIGAKLSAHMAKRGSTGMAADFATARGSAMLSKEDYETADELERSLRNVRATVSGIVTLFAVRLAPWVMKVTERFMTWWKVNRPAVLKGFEDGFKKIARALDSLWSAVTRLWDLVDLLRKSEAAMIALKFAIAGILAMRLGAWLTGVIVAMKSLTIAAALAKAQMMIVGLSVALIALAIEDIIGFFQGKDSLTGRFAEWATQNKALVVTLGPLAVGLVAIVSPLAAISAGFMGWAVAIKDIVNNWPIWKNILSEVADYASPAGWVRKGVKAISGVGDGKGKIDTSRYAPSSSMASGMGVWQTKKQSSVSTINELHLNIGKVVSPDPARAGDAVIDRLRSETRNNQGPVFR